MGTKIKLPNGNMTCNETMTSVQLSSKNVVICHDAQRRLIAWIAVKDPAKAKIVLNLMIDFAMAGKSAEQPCWDFLLETVPEEK